MNETYENTEHKPNDARNYQVSHKVQQNDNQNFARKNVTEQTKSQRDRFCNLFNQVDDDERRNRLEKVRDVMTAFEVETEEMNHCDHQKRQSQSCVQVICRRRHEGNQAQKVTRQQK